MTDLAARLQRALSASYAIERELGGGGMSRVFLARQRKLGREVVLKVVSPEAGIGDLADRFSREVMLAARLQQANIVPVLAAGVADGMPFYTMPYVRGDSLRRRLDIGPVPLPEAIGILRDVARALTFAHDEGVVHRDIKPENVLLSAGTAVVTDFGIAKAWKALQGDRDAGPRLTETGMSIGTLAYMAPEQAAGDPATDQRADLYSWGLVAWEVLAGRHPFAHATSPQALLAAQITEIPPGVDTVRPEVPATLARLIDRCLAKSPASRPGAAADLLGVIDQLSVAGVPLPAKRSPWRAPPWIIAAGVIVTVLVAVGQIWREGGFTRTKPGPDPSIRHIAVLPFADLSPGHADAYLGDGVAETLINTLARLPGIAVIGRTSAFSLREKADDIALVGRELGVSAVVTGSVQRAGDQLRVAARVVNVANRAVLWSATFDRAAAEIFAVQDEVARATSVALQGSLAPARSPALEGGTANPSAYDAYLLGRYHWNLRTTDGMIQATAAFRRAVGLDSLYARAWSGLADAYVLSIPGEYNVPGLSRDSLLSLAESAARRAIRLAPTLGEGHASLGEVLEALGRTEESIASFERGIALSPNYPTGHQWYSYALFGQGDWDRGVREMEKAHELDPLAPVITISLAMAYTGADRFDAATPLYDLGLAQAPDAWYGWRTLFAHHLLRGDRAAARVALIQAVRDSSHPSWPAWRDLAALPPDSAAWAAAAPGLFARGYDVGIPLLRAFRGDSAVVAALAPAIRRGVLHPGIRFAVNTLLGPRLRTDSTLQAAWRARPAERP